MTSSPSNPGASFRFELRSLKFLVDQKKTQRPTNILYRNDFVHAYGMENRFVYAIIPFTIYIT